MGGSAPTHEHAGRVGTATLSPLPRAPSPFALNRQPGRCSRPLCWPCPLRPHVGCQRPPAVTRRRSGRCGGGSRGGRRQRGSALWAEGWPEARPAEAGDFQPGQEGQGGCMQLVLWVPCYGFVGCASDARPRMSRPPTELSKPRRFRVLACRPAEAGCKLCRQRGSQSCPALLAHARNTSKLPQTQGPRAAADPDQEARDAVAAGAQLCCGACCACCSCAAVCRCRCACCPCAAMCRCRCACCLSAPGHHPRCVSLLDNSKRACPGRSQGNSPSTVRFVVN